MVNWLDWCCFHNTARAKHLEYRERIRQVSLTAIICSYIRLHGACLAPWVQFPISNISVKAAISKDEWNQHVLYILGVPRSLQSASSRKYLSCRKIEITSVQQWRSSSKGEGSPEFATNYLVPCPSHVNKNNPIALNRQYAAC